MSLVGERLRDGIERLQRETLDVEVEVALEDLPSRKPHIVEALLFGTLVTLVVSRRLLRAVRQALRGPPAPTQDTRESLPGAAWTRRISKL